MTAPRTPTRPAHLAVEVASHVLPPGAARSRYRQEFLSELHGLTGREQARQALSMLSHAWTLRIAVVHVAALNPGMIMIEQHIPLLCRMHVHHRWHLEHNPDGEEYLRCRGCGKDLYDVDRASGPNVGGSFAANRALS